VPAKNKNDAHNNFARSFRESLSVVTKSALHMRIRGDERVLYYEPPVKLQRHGGDSLYLTIVQTFRTVETGDGFRVSTTSYIYELLVKHGQELETIAEFHWHPNEEVEWPHVHVKGNSAEGALDRKHFPTGRLSLEDFIRFLMRDFDVRAIVTHATQKEILTRNKREFVANASWLYYKPLIS
jgi:hypothetical protein